MSRAHFTKPIVDDQGNLLVGATVRVLQPGTIVPITGTLWDSDDGLNLLTNPFQATNGVIDFYLDDPQRVRIGVTYGSNPEVFFEDVDVLEPVQPSGQAASSLFVLSGVVALAPTASGVYTYTTVPCFTRGLVYRIEVQSSGSANYGIRVRSQPVETADLLLDITNANDADMLFLNPWVYENGDEPSQPNLYIGIQDFNNDGSTFSLTQLRAEVFKA